MMRKILVVLVMILAIGVGFGGVAMADSYNGACELGIDDELAGDVGCGETTTVDQRVIQVINVVIYVVGIIAVGMIIFGGVRYAISQGDPGKVKNAKNAILYAIVGLIVTILAWAVVNFVISWAMKPAGSGADSSEEADDGSGGGTVRPPNMPPNAEDR
jgi:hypothetical protein